MKKKICGLLVGLVMMFPILANAEEVENYAKIGNEEYATLKEAVEAAEVCTDLSTCDVTTIEVVASHETSGIIFVEGKNLVIDLGGFTVTFKAPTVGSKGTQTIDMQILKNSNVTFQNGKFVSSDTDKSKMFIQNYANLTLKDVEIVAMNDLNQYAVSNNSGDVNIIGNTSIKAKRVAFDVCGFHAHGYKIGPKVVVDTTGTIEGTIEVSAEEGEKTRELSLLVKNMNHVGEFSVLSEDLNDNITIMAGTYTDKDTVSKLPLETGNDVYEVITLDGEIEYVVAKEEELEEGYFGLGFDRETLDKVEDDELEETLKLVDEALANKYKAAIYYEIKYGPLLNNRLVTDETTYKTELDEEVEITLDIPEGLEKVKEGYKREYSVIRVHLNKEGKYETDILDAIENKDGTVTFKTDRFSTYVLAYEDVNNPKTFDGITSYIILGGLSLVALIAVSVVAKKKAFN